MASQNHFTLSFPLKSATNAKALSEELPSMMPGLFQVEDAIGTMLSPETDSPAGGILPEQLNNFEYVNADGSGDPKGLRCPVGAHMRRINPRGQPVTGQGVPGSSNNTHRLIRRGMPLPPMNACAIAAAAL